MTGHTEPYYWIFGTAGGYCGIASNSSGITHLQLTAKSAEAAERMLLRRAPGTRSFAPAAEIIEVAAAVQRYFEGEATDFSSVRLDLGDQDELFKQIYAAARQIGWGHTTTYGALAKTIGAGPEAAREVGRAMSGNPVPLIIPCHRVLAAGGKIGGFSAPGGAATKIHMLELEGVHVAPPRPPQLSLKF